MSKKAKPKTSKASAPRGAPAEHDTETKEEERDDLREAEAASPTPEPPSWRWPLAGAGLVALIVIAIRFYPQPSVEVPDTTPLVLGDGDELTPEPPAPERLRVNVIHRYPHQPDAFTQGLLWHDAQLFESTGLRGRSSLRRVALETGEVLQRYDVPRPVFAEGLARVGDELYQLSWTEGILQVYGLETFEPLRRIEYEGEGWGLCYDGTHLVMSDGSDRLTFRDPETFDIVRTVTVTANGDTIDELNELECVDGLVWANVWQTDRILRIDARTGNVTGFVDASGLLDPGDLIDADVLNGIAWIPERQHFLITGKLWPTIFEVTFELALEPEE